MNSSNTHNNIRIFHDKLQQISAPLNTRLPPEKVAPALAMVGALAKHAIPGTLINLEVDQLTDFIVRLYEIVDHRDQAVCSEYLDLPMLDSGILVCNCRDASYLFETLLLFMKREHLYWSVIAHLCLNVERSNGSVVRLSDAQQQCADESLMIVQVGAGACSAQCLEAIKQRLGLVIQLQEDTPQLESRFHELLPHAAHVGYNKFWQWLLEGNFTPLSYRQMNIVGAGENARLELVDSASLGLPVDPALMQESLALCDPERRSCMLRSSWLVVEETNVYCPVWRNETYISIYLRQEISASEAEPQYIEHVIFGLYLANTHQQSALTIPALNSKITQALDRLNIAPCTYNFRKVEELLATFPKTELFFLSADQLDEIIKSLLFFNHSSIRVIPIDNELNSLSLLLIVPCSLSPNADFSKIETHLKRFFNAHSLITRILQFHSDYYIVQLNINSSGVIDITDLDTLNANLTNLMQSWEQKLRLILVREHGSRMGQELWHKYANVFCANYRSTIHPRFCARDIAKLERVLESKSEQVELWGPVTATNTACRLQFYSTQQGYLNELMPVLVNLDLTIIDEIDFSVTVAGRDLYIKSFGVLNKLPGSDSLLQVKTRLLDALMVLRSGLAENDYLNRLLVSTGLDWQQIDIFRGYRNYYFQLGTSFSKKTVAFALINNPRSVLALYRYFEARFKPDERWSNMMDREEQALFPARLELIDALQDVDNVNDDRILRTFFNLIDSTVRTNFYKRKGCEDYFFSFKISAIGINEMPVPRPLFEIYVHNAEMEGIHLRGGMVARGGIRWSDRPDDFRTEILGLMKTQMTKNALIVPVGSKGGFIIKQVYTEREQGMALSKRAYQTLMRGLLDLTDNRVAGKVVAPVDIIRYDEDDPYLVVAADKGTAHLPDTANGVSGEYDFWLGDGFASGGSRGYDHKELGITARGAWVCVQRHFREMTLDIQQQPFTVVGIGDMSGDVFGNGMLLSEQICLKAAFNHRHIFLDPNPDPVTTFAERQRLFDLPRSSWNDFDAALISAGGGVYERDAKEIPLSAQIQQWLGVRHESLDPDSLIQLLLRAEVDLLWNGGIGTYVKSSSQKNEDAGDRSNDSLRINGNQIRAKVIGEGGNLGMTQLARIEYALNGGRINTDAIDNSAGVDCSDHEVNLKIFMRHLIETGQVADIDERDKLLGAVTEHVSLAVLGNNYGQSLSLSLDLLRNQVERELFVDLSSRLVAVGLLDRQSETLPSTKEILARKQGYTRPELSILMAYSKMHLFRSILDDSDFLEDDSAILASYFPQPIQQQFARQLQEHPLRREIVATVITNNVIDCGGSTFCFRLARMYDVSWPAAAKAHNHFSQVIGATELRKSIYALDDSIPCTAQYKLLLEVETSINTMCDWSFSQNKGMLENSKIVPLQQYLAEFIKILSSVLDQAVWQRCQDRQDELVAYGISKDLAARFAALPVLESLLPLVSLVEELDGEIHSIALTLNEVKSRFAIDGLLAQLQHVALRDSWDRMTQHLLIMRFNHVLFRLTQKVLQEYNGNLDALLSAQRKNYQRYNTLAEQVHTQAALNFHPFVVVFEQLNSMC